MQKLEKIHELRHLGAMPLYCDTDSVILRYDIWGFCQKYAFFRYPKRIRPTIVKELDIPNEEILGKLKIEKPDMTILEFARYARVSEFSNFLIFSPGSKQYGLKVRFSLVSRKMDCSWGIPFPLGFSNFNDFLDA